MLSSPACMRDDVSAKAPPPLKFDPCPKDIYMDKTRPHIQGGSTDANAQSYPIPHTTILYTRRDGEHQVLMHFVQLSTS